MKTENQLIAEFMGMTSSFDTYFCPTQNCHFTIEDLKYDTSWDWLMPVIEKIANMWEPNFESEMCHQTAHIAELPISSHIQQVYKEVVDFIKYYNQQPKQS